jgi:hypothetical protein
MEFIWAADNNIWTKNMTDQDFLSLREFWHLFSKMSPAISGLPLPVFSSLIYGLNRYFGDLTNHSLDGKSQPVKIKCKSCRNCTINRKEYICETHCGIISGTIEFLLGEQMDITYQPDENTGNCLITITKQRS